MPQKVLINFTDAQLLKMGACKTQADFQAAVDLAIEESGAPKTEQKVVALEDFQKLLAKQAGEIGAMGTQIAALDTSLKSINPEALIKQAQDAASITAAEKLGQVGATGAAAAPAGGNESEAPADNLKALETAGDYEGMWKASESIQSDFPSGPKAFAAYKRAEKRNGIRQFTPATK